MSPISETGRLAGIEAIPTACPEPTYHYRTGSVCIVRISGETVLSAGANAAAIGAGGDQGLDGIGVQPVEPGLDTREQARDQDETDRPGAPD
ncbi:hypothetical protein JMM59_00365 [Rhodovulum sulfidophilum]|uniref:hypothetical protein n=1 Tax=Rhodovulum sulfidophilum TaxID=35806 RepID=UPI001923CEC8|nr:hypothetical protein [Rhodovulum sulfidophilum]MBL3563480.1 hypothetical protein [Rhodovulum sulfidophilum]